MADEKKGCPFCVKTWSEFDALMLRLSEDTTLSIRGGSDDSYSHAVNAALHHIFGLFLESGVTPKAIIDLVAESLESHGVRVGTGVIAIVNRQPGTEPVPLTARPLTAAERN